MAAGGMKQFLVTFLSKLLPYFEEPLVGIDTGRLFVKSVVKINEYVVFPRHLGRRGS
jgi:hypothetical protein